MFHASSAYKKRTGFHPVLAKAGVLGFEPRQRDPESRVLPLDDTPTETLVIYAMSLSCVKDSGLFFISSLRGSCQCSLPA